MARQLGGGFYAAFLRGRAALLVPVVLAIVVAAAGVAQAQPFTPTGSMATERYLHTATLLSSGKVLIVGGVDNSGNILASAEVYDPATGTFTEAGRMTTPRAGHTATLLNNGHVLVTGGLTTALAAVADPVFPALESAEIFDPGRGAFGAFATVSSMTSPRFYHTATVLADGRVLVAGGGYATQDNFLNTLHSAEVYNPRLGTFSSVGNMRTDRALSGAARLPDGTVLVIGGESRTSGTDRPLLSTELFDPSTGTFSPGAAMHMPRYQFDCTMLANGTLLVVGGSSTPSAESYDYLSGTFSIAASMTVARDSHRITRLANGNVLVTGGVATTTAEMYYPEARFFSSIGTMTITQRSKHSATLLPDGTVLVVGGHRDNFGVLASAEIYTPPTDGPIVSVNDQTVTVSRTGSVIVTLTGLASSPAARPLTYQWSNGGTTFARTTSTTVTLGLGIYRFVFTALDSTGLAASTAMTVTVELPSGGVGPQGLQGPKGDTGATGPQGLKGDTGDTGVQGPKGDTGATGPQGLTGDTGEPGTQGPKGDAGAIGNQGPKGDTGAPGIQGPKGDTGATGTQGAKGDAGATGTQGPKGDPGATGSQGSTGAQGPKGDTGFTGAQGIAGPTGATGAQGPTGLAGTGSVGPTGPPGPVGPAGPQGFAVPSGTLILVVGTEAAPSGWVLVGSTTLPIKKNNVNTIVTLNIYQKQ